MTARLKKVFSAATAVCLGVSLLTPASFAAKTETFDTTKVPTPVFDENPGYVELYWKAWELAYDHVVEDPGVPHSPYMDEVCYDNVIWIWDSCFMTLFNRYAADDYFPGVANLNNIYMPLYDNADTTQSIWFADNPNLLAWVEWENYMMSGDVDHVKWLINEKQYLQQHYQMMETSKPGDTIPHSSHRIAHERTPYGYTGSNQIVGMDNSPRGRTFGESGILWIDTISQQALSAYYIAKLAEAAGNEQVKTTYLGYYDELKSLINQYYWDEADGIYYDINKTNPLLKDKVKTVASFWPMLALVPDAAQAEALLAHLNSPASFGGFVDFPSVARDDPDFDNETGAYWRGGLWLPTAYMGIKGLENYGYVARADEAAEKILEQQYQTYKNVVPHTIWETYAPSANAPSTEYGNIVRQDFCGWSALGPISLFIENVLGFHQVNAVDRVIEWRLHQEGRHGITNFTFGNITTDIVANDGIVTIRSNGSYTLKVNGVNMPVSPGIQSYSLSGQAVEPPDKLPFDPTPIPAVPVNIALNKAVSAASYQDAAHTPDKGNDGNGSTMWIAANGDPGNWWMVDLGEAYQITGGSISFEAEALWKYQIQASMDGESWTTVADRSQNSLTSPVQEFAGDVTARYVKVTVTECPDGCWTAFRELELYGAPLAVNVALNKAAAASSFENSGRRPSCGNDGNLSSMWIAGDGSLDQWWMVDLGESHRLSGSKITFETEGGLWGYYIEGSEDGVAWTVLADCSDNGSTAEVQAHAYTAAARYVRVTFTALPDDCWAAFREFEVFGVTEGQ